MPPLANCNKRYRNEAEGMMSIQLLYIKQLESASLMNKRKRTADQAFQNDDDYLYGIVSTGMNKLMSLSQILFYTF